MENVSAHCTTALWRSRVPKLGGFYSSQQCCPARLAQHEELLRAEIASGLSSRVRPPNHSAFASSCSSVAPLMRWCHEARSHFLVKRVLELQDLLETHTEPMATIKVECQGQTPRNHIFEACSPFTSDPSPRSVLERILSSANRWVILGHIQNRGNSLPRS